MSSADVLEVMRWKVIKITHWSDQYVDSLSMGTLHKYLQLEDGLTKAKR